MGTEPGLDAQAAVSATAGYARRAPRREPPTPFFTVLAAAQAKTPWQGVTVMAWPWGAHWTVMSEPVPCSQAPVVEVSSGEPAGSSNRQPCRGPHIEFRPEDEPLRKGRRQTPVEVRGVGLDHAQCLVH